MGEVELKAMWQGTREQHSGRRPDVSPATAVRRSANDDIVLFGERPAMRGSHPATRSLAVIILTYNEEAHLARALANVVGWAHEVFVVDSMSTDRTLEIASEHDCHLIQHRFENFAKQRNFALDHLPIRSEWVLFLDADEWLPDSLREEISQLIATSPLENGFDLRFRFMWMGRWIRRGYYSTRILRLFRYRKGRCEDRAVNERPLVEGPIGHLRHHLVHEDRKGVTEWIAKHNRYARLEALELLHATHDNGYRELDARLFGAQAERRRWIRQRIWNRLPPLVRPFAYFTYRYLLAGGFLDGKAGLTYHFLQALWFPFLIDVKYLELRREERQRSIGQV
jgi:glycosyltransferase involved in cell wall biosynthesis